MVPGGLIERLSAICSQVGFDLHQVDAQALSRLALLAERSQTVSDLERMAGMAFALFREYDAERPHETFSDMERSTVILGCLFSDIGKTGPAAADHHAQRLIVDMFSVEGVQDESQSVTEFLRRYFPGDADERIERFVALGLDPTLTMRQFWNLHSAWTLDIVDAAGVPVEAVAAAATHHLLDDVNPADIVGADHRFTRCFGDNTCFDRAEKLVIVLDKYDALRRRGRLSHERAIAWLRERVANSPRFRGDHELETLITDMEHVGGAGDEGTRA